MRGPKSLFLGALALAMASSASAQTAPQPSEAAASLQQAVDLLASGRRGTARPHARRALDLATADPQSGVDVAAAELVLAQTQIASERHSRNDEFWASVQAAAQRPELARYVYAAAMDLANVEQRDSRYQRTASIMAFLAEHPEGAPEDVRTARARAMIRRAENLIYSSAFKRRTELLPDEILAHDLLHEAVVAVNEMRAELPDDRPIHDADRVFGLAIAWHGTLAMRVVAFAPPWAGDEAGRQHFVSPRSSNHVSCPVRVNAEPRPEFPQGAYARAGVGAVTMILTVDETNRITAREIAAVAPPAEHFSAAITSVWEQWTIEDYGEPPPGCVRGGYLVSTVLFGYTQ